MERERMRAGEREEQTVKPDGATENESYLRSVLVSSGFERSIRA